MPKELKPTPKFEETRDPLVERKTNDFNEDGFIRNNAAQLDEYFHFLPPDNPTVGRSLKLRDLNTLSGAIIADSDVVTVAGTAGETTLKEFDIYPNELHKGIVLRVTAVGLHTTDDASATFLLSFKIGSTTHASFTSVPSTTTDRYWKAEWLMMINSIGTSGVARSTGYAFITGTFLASGGTASTTVDTTATQTVSLTAAWTGGSAGDSVSIGQFLVEVLH